MLNFDQQDALGNMLTGLSGHSETFKKDLWEVFEDYSPHQSFTISGIRYYRALNSIPESVKLNIVLRIIDVIKFDTIYAHDVLRSLAYLNVCGTVGFFLMNILINVLHTFGVPQTVWARTKDEDDANVVTLMYDSDFKNVVYIFCHEEEDVINFTFNKDLLRTEYPFGYYPDDDTLTQIVNDLIKRDTLTEGNRHFMNSYINEIYADDNRAFNTVDFFIGGMSFINANGAYC